MLPAVVSEVPASLVTTLPTPPHTALIRPLRELSGAVVGTCKALSELTCGLLEPSCACNRPRPPGRTMVLAIVPTE